MRPLIYIQVYRGHFIAKHLGNGNVIRKECAGLEHPRTLMGDFHKVQEGFSIAIKELLHPINLLKPKGLVHLVPVYEGGYTNVEIRAFKEAGEMAGMNFAFLSTLDRPHTDSEVLEVLGWVGAGLTIHSSRARIVTAMSGQLIGRTGLFQALGALMLKIEHRRMQRSNGLIDDFVVSGEPVDYVTFATTVEAAIKSGAAETLRTESRIQIEVLSDSQQPELFTSLQNTEDCYPSLEDWERRSVLRIRGSTAVLKELYQFLMDVSGRGDGYSYLSEYSSRCAYSSSSPEWRLHL